jgi:hypothetical protein
VPILTAQFFDLPDLSTPYHGPAAANVDPFNFVTALQNQLATNSITTEFLTDPPIHAFTDWTFSSPTRRYAVAADYRGLTASPATPVLRAFDAVNPFWQAANTSVSGFQICTNTAAGGVTFLNREELTQVGSSFVISPNPPAPTFRLCGEVSVLTFNAPSGASVLGAEIAKTLFDTGTVRDGWATVGTPGATAAGLPIVGKSFSAASAGTLNVGGSWEHRYVPTFP